MSTNANREEIIPAEAPEVVGTDDMSRRLGGLFSPWSLRQMAKRGQVPHIRISNRLHWVVDDVFQWLREGGVEGKGLRDLKGPER